MLFTHRNPEMQLDKEHTALVVADLQNEFLRPDTGTYYELIEDSLREHDVASHLEQLLQTAQDDGYFVIHSPHWYSPTDLQWVAPAAHRRLPVPHRLRRALELGLPGRLRGLARGLLRAVQEVHQRRQDGHDLPAQGLRLRVERHRQAAAPAPGREGHHGRPGGNLCLEAHMRDLIEAGFEVAMVRDAVAGGVTRRATATPPR